MSFGEVKGMLWACQVCPLNMPNVSFEFFMLLFGFLDFYCVFTKSHYPRLCTNVFESLHLVGIQWRRTMS